MLGLLGKKIGMTQVFDENGRQTAVTVIEAGPIYVTQIKTKEKDGYNALQVAFGEEKKQRLNKPELGHFEKAGVEALKKVVEFPVEDPESYELGQEIKVDIFKEGQFIDVTGTSKGKGTAGIIKRHNESRGPMAHGSKFHRTPGARSASATPGRVVKGQRGPGRMGYERVTVQKLEVIRVDADRNLLLVKGGVPGPRKGFLSMKPSVKVSK
ncbi:MAG: 50S ribosomal protein L3 [Tissierellia bacterium]|nr:50S ribosomal protein L3 [Tissierellia bacterium]